MKRLLKARLPTITSPDPFVVTVDGKEVKFLEMDIAILGMKTDRVIVWIPPCPHFASGSCQIRRGLLNPFNR
jgi:hypothetical protein